MADTRKDREGICEEIKDLHGYCKRRYNKKTGKWVHVGACIADKPKPAQLQVVTKQDTKDLRGSQRLLQPDEPELLASLGRLEAMGCLFAIRENPPTLRILLETDPQCEAKKHKAIIDGFSLWKPRDIFEYIHLPEHERGVLRNFKKIFADGGFEWEVLKT